MRREERGLDGGGFFNAQPCGLVSQCRCAGAQPACITGRGEAEHRVADGKSRDRTAHARDTAGELHADGGPGKAVLDGFVRQQAHCVHDIAEIQARGHRFHFDFIRLQRECGQREPLQVAERTC